MAVTTGTDTDSIHLARALELAERGRGRVHPNPLVGAVLARDGEVLGEGHHTAFGAPHAECEAIAAAAGADLQGATLYVSLEPCCHQGKTPPCTEAIVAAGIRRVVVACDDPSSKAAGRGLGHLRDEGVEVEMAQGELASGARLLNQPFRKHARTGRPHVMFKAALTLDGKVATEGGDSKWISSAPSRELVHRWRGECDAVAVGIGTVLADDPQLTSRLQDTSRPPQDAPRQPRRVIFDSEARLPLSCRLVSEAPRVPLIVVASRAAGRASCEALEAAGAEVVIATGANEPARIASALDQLGAMDIASIMLEGGPHLSGAFFDAAEVDEMRLFIAPLVLGGRTARVPVEGEGSEAIAGARRALSMECEEVGVDLLITARLHEW